LEEKGEREKLDAMTTKRYSLLYWGLAGFLVPVMILIVGRLQGGVFEWPYLAITLWPTWMMAGALDAFEDPPLSSILIILTISIGLNVVLYTVVGAIFRWFFEPFDRKQ
jgi:hypothetical protein